MASFSANAFPEVEILPESLQQQFHTFGLFIDQQSVLYGRDAKRAWGSIAGNVALFELKGFESRPQLVLSASANSGFGINSKMDTLLTETTDARAGLSWNWAESPTLRFSAGWQHQSGHISDNVRDTDLIGSNLGNELFFVRAIWDRGSYLRLGGTFKPYVGTEPKMNWFAADQFIEWMPWGNARSPKRPTPYLSGGLEQYGASAIYLSWHLNVGVYIGNHFDPVHRTLARLVVGYYDGVDPRLKYAQFKGGKISFSYFGLSFDI